MPSALVLIAEGTEEMEFTIAYDVLVRGGVEVHSALVGETSTTGSVKCSRGVRIVPDITFSVLSTERVLAYDAIVVPGGVGGAKTISKDDSVQAALAAMHENGKIVAAVCAGSLAVRAAGIAKGDAITSHPSVKKDLAGDYDYKEQRVVVDKNLITSRGPGTSFEFALALVEALQGKEKREEIAGPMILPEKH